jgi:coenzyme F420-0:L-glutamate ligase/coenzyme F420-1:gamma-L-glutamate ligase
MEEFQAFLRSRRSVRRFRTTPVPTQLIETILTTAGFSPSAHNRQPWRYVVVRGEAAKATLAEAMGEEFRHDLLADGYSPAEAETQVTNSRRRIETAPVVVCLCTDFACIDHYPDPNRRGADSLMLVQDTALSGMLFMLAAHAEGLGTVWMCAPMFAPESVRETLGLPDLWEPQALILMGFAERLPEPRPRKPIHEIAWFR